MADHLDSILPWFQERQAESAGFKAEETSLPEGGDWRVNPEGPILVERADGRFFRLLSLLISGAKREVSSWIQPLLEELDAQEFRGRKVTGLILLVRREIEGLDEYLVQARAEPGHTDLPGNVVLGPTIQASFSNIKQNGAKIPLWNQLGIDLARLETELNYGSGVEVRFQPKDGGRFLAKNNLILSRLLTPEEADTLTLNAKQHVWVTRQKIAEVQEAGWANEHLNEALGFFGPKF